RARSKLRLIAANFLQMGWAFRSMLCACASIGFECSCRTACKSRYPDKVSEKMATGDNEQLLIAYLLGELPEEENARIEEQYLADETAFAPLLAIESELYDAYANNALSPERRLHFEQKFLRTPEQHGKLEFSRALLRVPRENERPARTQMSWSRMAAVAAV